MSVYRKENFPSPKNRTMVRSCESCPLRHFRTMVRSREKNRPSQPQSCGESAKLMSVTKYEETKEGFRTRRIRRNDAEDDLLIIRRPNNENKIRELRCKERQIEKRNERIPRQTGIGINQLTARVADQSEDGGKAAAKRMLLTRPRDFAL